MSIIAKAEESVTASTPSVVEALGRIKFLLIVIPVIGVIIGIVSQQLFEERNISTAIFKLGTFATPQRPEPVALAGENQMRARLRAYATEIDDKYSGALLLTTIVDNDVVSVTATAEGEGVTNLFLEDLIQHEIDFQNVRFDKLKGVQNERKRSLEAQLQDIETVIKSTEASRRKVTEPLEVLAIQHELDNARDRKSKISLELSTIDLLNASDLYIDTTQFIQPPIEIASSNWYRPIIYGLIGLAGGIAITLLIALVAVVRAVTRKSKGSDPKETNSA